jgi:uncharacterized protein
MRRALTTAMKARDQRAVAALRSALAAIDNAEAVDTAKTSAADGAAVNIIRAAEGSAAEGPAAEGDPAGGGEIAGAAVGVGAAEVERRALTPAEVETIVRGEVAERRAAAHAYERAGQSGRAQRLRAEAEVLSAYLAEPGGELGSPGA